MAGLMSDKKKALLAYKEEVLRDIKYFENRIKVTQSQKNDSSYFDDDDSDSDNDFTLNTGPSISQLKLEQGMLQTCLHATQELTSLYVLQSEVNVMVEDPVLEREPPVMEEGMWREVTAECRVDLVPFSITFFTHKPTRLYGPVSYRGLRVLPVKAAHENELQKSILPQLGTPSDAVEVLRSYAVAYRSRRTTLARLAEKYPNNLFMEPMADGGYIIKCADLLEVSWILENKWSPVAAFHHRMKFDLEYMEEAYVKIISQAHKELSDPSLTTDERTRLMAKIIATCLEARGTRYESMESDLESENPKSVFNEEIEDLQKKDSEVMAPPKSLPKRIKPKGKENTIDNRKATKRTATDDKIDAKKARLNKDGRNSVASASKDSVAIVNKENNGINQVSDNIVQKDTNKGSKSKAKEIGASSKKSNDVGDAKKSNKISNNVKESDNNPKKSDTVNKNTNIKNVNAKNTKRVENNEDDFNNPKLSKGHNINEGTSYNTEISNHKSNKENTSNKNGNLNANPKGTNKNNPKSANTEKDNKVISNNNKDNIPKKSVTKVNSKDVASVNGIANKNDEVVAKNSVAKTKSDKVRNVASTNPDKNNEIVAKKSVKAKSTDNVNVASTNTVFNNNNDVITKKSVGKSSAGNLKSVASVNANSNAKDAVIKKSVVKTKSTANVKNVASVNTISNKNDVPTKDVATKSSNVNDNNTDTNINDNAKKNAKGKSLKRPSENDVQNSIKIKDKDDIPLQKKKKKNNMNSDVIKQNIESHSNGDSNRDNIKENINNTNKFNKIPENAKIEPKSKTKSTQIKNSKQNINKDKEKLVSQDFEKTSNSKNHDPLQKVTVKSKSTNAKTIDKLTDKIAHKQSNVANNKVGDKNVASNRKHLEVNDNIDRNINDNDKNNEKTNDKNTYGNNDKIIHRNNDKNIHRNNDKNIHRNNDKNIHSNNDKNNDINYKMFKSNIKEKIVSAKNLDPKSPVQKLKVLNHRNKIPPKRKENNENIKTQDGSKFTKIPQKLSKIHGVKKNPLRISPRKTSSISKSDFQNVSKTSQISVQKSVTGIPRLLKKPISKTKT